jgi:hypothetical protein
MNLAGDVTCSRSVSLNAQDFWARVPWIQPGVLRHEYRFDRAAVHSIFNNHAGFGATTIDETVCEGLICKQNDGPAKRLIDEARSAPFHFVFSGQGKKAN